MVSRNFRINRPSGLQVVGLILASFVIVLVVFLLLAGLVMLLLGVSHSADPRVPALGFDATWPLVLAIGIATGGARAKASSS